MSISTICVESAENSFSRLTGRVSPELVKAMADTIRHRGPDDEGYYVSGPVGLGFRRLSIIDLQTRPPTACKRRRLNLDCL